MPGHGIRVHSMHGNPRLLLHYLQMVIRRYFSKDEVQERMSRMQEDFEETVALRASEVTGEDIRPPSRTESLKHSGSVRRKGTRDDDNRRKSLKFHDDDDDKYNRRKSSVRRGTVIHLDSSDSDDDDDEYGRRREKKGGRNKKKTKAIKYGGHTAYVTDSEQSSSSELDDDRVKHGKKGEKRKEEEGFIRLELRIVRFWRRTWEEAQEERLRFWRSSHVKSTAEERKAAWWWRKVVIEGLEEGPRATGVMSTSLCVAAGWPRMRTMKNWSASWNPSPSPHSIRSRNNKQCNML